MFVSVVLTVINEGPGLHDLLDGLFAQSRAPDEVVVVDGGSKDDTVTILRERAALEPRLAVHVEPGANISRGRNIAIERARGDVIAVTDGGCRPERDWLRELLQPLEADPTVAAVAGRFVHEAANRFEHYSGRLSMPDLGSETQRGMFYGRSSAFRREVWQRAGGYPEWLYTGEDTLFALAVGRLSGWRVAYAPDSIVHWRPRPTLRKLAKMFYLYGRGNGRIGHGSLQGSLYWIRSHGLVAFVLLAGLAWPWAWLALPIAMWPLWQGVVRPNLDRLSDEPSDRFWYVPLITLARNAATNLGYLRGWLELRRGAGFRQHLDQYLERCD
jgi:glycosyltransferase involved in cell wall biosynthesis